MANAQYTIGEGVTEPVIIQLLDVEPITDEGTPVDLAGVTLIDMRIRSEDETATFNYDTTNDPARLSINDSATGKIEFTPLGTEFLASEMWYNAFFFVTDAAGSIIRFPSEGNFQIQVVEQF